MSKGRKKLKFVHASNVILIKFNYILGEILVQLAKFKKEADILLG